MTPTNARGAPMRRGGARRALACGALALAILVCASPALGQRGGGARRALSGLLGNPNDYYRPPAFAGNPPYDGRFTFARIKYRGFSQFSYEGPGWSHDYPDAETHLMKIMREVTMLRPFVEKGKIAGGAIVGLDEPELFRYPIGYLSEPGGWTPTAGEVAGMRTWLLKGGFVIFDDMGGSYDMNNVTTQMRRVLPDARIVRLTGEEPIFDSFYKVDLDIISRSYRSQPAYYGIFEDNDPKKRLMAIINMNGDVGEYWQWSERGFSPVPVTNEAYKLGVNYLVYALTH